MLQLCYSSVFNIEECGVGNWRTMFNSVMKKSEKEEKNLVKDINFSSNIVQYSVHIAKPTTILFHMLSSNFIVSDF